MCDINRVTIDTTKPLVAKKNTDSFTEGTAYVITGVGGASDVPTQYVILDDGGKNQSLTKSDIQQLFSYTERD